MHSIENSFHLVGSDEVQSSNALHNRNGRSYHSFTFAFIDMSQKYYGLHLLDKI